MNSVFKISIAGSGKVAEAFSHALKDAGHSIVQIFSRNQHTGLKLADEVGAQHILSNDDIINVDLFAVLVSDDSIFEVSNLLPSDIPQFHASGVTGIDVLNSKNSGVVWPIKSINSKSSNSSLQGTPMAIEANDEGFGNMLSKIVESIGGQGFNSDSKQRAIIHLAAVFTDNFANHCLSLSQEILKENGISPTLMSTLAQGLVDGAKNGDSVERQTGVALRGDLGSQLKHLDLLDGNAKKEFYKFLSKQIKEYHELQG